MFDVVFLSLWCHNVFLDSFLELCINGLTVTEFSVFLQLRFLLPLTLEQVWAYDTKIAKNIQNNEYGWNSLLYLESPWKNAFK